MRHFIGRSLFWQLIVPMVVVMGLWLASASVAVVGFTQSRGLMHGLYNNNVQLLFHLETLKRHFSKHNLLVLQHIATESAAQMQAILDAMDEERTLLGDDLKNVRGLFSDIHPEQADDLSHLKGLVDRYLDAVRDVLKASRDFEKETASALYRERLQHLIHDADALLGGLTDLEADSMAAAYRRSLFLDRKNAIIIGVASVAAGILSFVILFTIAMMSARRLQSVVNCATAIRDGDLSARTNERSDDEIGRLGRAIDRMAAQLQRTMGALDDTARALRVAHGDLERRVADRTRELEDEIAVRTRTEEHLKLAKEQADLANRAKSEFLANMSHELRTPLNAIIGFSGITMAELFGPLTPKYREYAEDVHASGHHLLALINEILDMAKIETGNLELSEEVFDPVQVVDEVIRLIRAQPNKAIPRIVTDLPDDAVRLRADPRRVKQVLVNLLSNAAKFTPSGGEIVVSLAGRPDGALTLSVADTGIGMTPEELATALEPFGQVENSFTRRHEGTGLGLPLAKKLMEQHDGTLEIRSEKGAGTTVIVTFPPGRVVPPSVDAGEPGFLTPGSAQSR